MSTRGLRRLPQSKGIASSSSSSCGVALFLLGLNIGLSFLLIVMVAGHLQPPSNLDNSEYNTYGSIQKMSQMQGKLLSEIKDDGVVKEDILRIESHSQNETSLETMPCDFNLSSSSSIKSTKTVLPQNVRNVSQSNQSSGTSRWHESVLSRKRSEAEEACRLGKCKVYYVHIHKSGGRYPYMSITNNTSSSVCVFSLTHYIISFSFPFLCDCDVFYMCMRYVCSV